jgi:hypothetical protein
MLHWSTHTDIEGMLAAEADVPALAAAMEEVRAEVDSWDEHQQPLTDVVRKAVGDHDDLGKATDVPSLIAPFDVSQQRTALAALLRGKQPGFKSARDQRLICHALPAVPPTAIKAMEIVHGFVDGEGEITGEHAL